MSSRCALPEGTRLRVPPGEPTAWPIVQCANVFVLPGVPELYVAKVPVVVVLTLCCCGVALARPRAPPRARAPVVVVYTWHASGVGG